MTRSPLPGPTGRVFDYVDLLYRIYGSVRGEWPPAEEWPVPFWPVLDGAR
jgi:hypothetical protein